MPEENYGSLLSAISSLDASTLLKTREKLLLTPRQKEILESTAEGLTTGEAAKKNAMAVETVKTHKKKILLRLNAKNMANAVAIGIRNDLIK